MPCLFWKKSKHKKCIFPKVFDFSEFSKMWKIGDVTNIHSQAPIYALCNHNMCPFAHCCLLHQSGHHCFGWCFFILGGHVKCIPIYLIPLKVNIVEDGELANKYSSSPTVVLFMRWVCNQPPKVSMCFPWIQELVRSGFPSIVAMLRCVLSLSILTVWKGR